MKHAVVLLSGGLDSTTTLAIAIAQGYDVYALSFDYGQRHKIEIEAARRIAKSLGVKEHRVVEIDNRLFGDSALTDDVDVPKSRSEKEISAGIPVTYVPARNTIFLSHALAWAETIPAGHIFLGVNAIDYSGYPDCRPEFIAMFETARQPRHQSGRRRSALSDSHAADQDVEGANHSQSARARCRSCPDAQLLRSRARMVAPAANAIPVSCAAKVFAKPA